MGDKKIVDSKGKNKVWTLDGNTLTAHDVQIGMSDGTHTEILGGISQGKDIITELKVISDTPEDEDSQQRSIFGPPRRDQKKK